MEQSDIQKIRELPIVEVAERLGLKVVRHKSLCCFHDDHTPSLYYNVRKNTYRCFSCGASGGVIDLAMHMLQKPFYDTCRQLASDENILLSEYKPKTEKEEPKVDLLHLQRLMSHPELNAEARQFLSQRFIHPAVVKWLGLSSISAPTAMSSMMRPVKFNAPSLLIPYRDKDGALVTVQARYLGQRDAKTGQPPRFQFPRGSRCGIFNQPVLKLLREGEDLWIAEGCSDCMALLSAGHKAIAIPSATLLDSDDIRLLHDSLPPSSSLHIYPDKDDAGEKLYTRLVKVAVDLKHTLFRHDLPEGCKDFSDWWVRQNKNKL